MARSQDIYERPPAYPEPPRIPLPAPDDFSSLRPMGVKVDSPIARAALRAFFRLSGFTSFLEGLRRSPESLDRLLRTTHTRGHPFFPAALSASASLRDDPGCEDPFLRAASLLLAARELHRDLWAGRLEADTFRGTPLEMGQHANLFSTCTILEGGEPRIYKSDATDRIGVLYRGEIHLLRVPPVEEAISLADLSASLRRLVEEADEEPPRPSPAPITGADHRTQPRLLTELEKSPENRRSLAALRECFLILCLDLEETPEDDAALAHRTQSGYENRWFHTSLEIVVFKNAKAGALLNTSNYLDGNVVMRGAAELQRRGARIVSEEAREGTPRFGAERLAWELDPAALEEARESARRYLDEAPATYRLPIGTRDFERRDVPPIACFCMAVHAAASELIEGEVHLSQMLTLSKYRHMGLTSADIATNESSVFCNMTAENSQYQHDIRIQFDRAARSQREAMREKRRCFALSSLFLSYYLPRLGGMRKAFLVVLGVLLVGLLLPLGLLRPPWRGGTSVTLSHPAIHPEVTVIGRPGVRPPYMEAFSLHYQIFEEETVITVMRGPRWETSSREVVERIEARLRGILDALEGEMQR